MTQSHHITKKSKQLRFKKIYIEITNSCNFNCSFCFKTARATKFMSPDEFRLVVEKIRPFTNYIYLHVLGEPLLHPQLDEILTIAEAAGLNINITTNGVLLERKKEILFQHAVRQMNISLHDAEENIAPEKWEDYLNSALDFAQKVSPNTYICLRLWNSTNETSQAFNSQFICSIATEFNISEDKLQDNTSGNGIKLAEHIFLQRAPRFDWPDENKEGSQIQKHCYALRDHIAILADGLVVPCCLDANANMKLGNIFEEEMDTILKTEKARRILTGFANNTITEKLCQTCGFHV